MMLGFHGFHLPVDQLGPLVGADSPKGVPPRLTETKRLPDRERPIGEVRSGSDQL